MSHDLDNAQKVERLTGLLNRAISLIDKREQQVARLIAQNDQTAAEARDLREQRDSLAGEVERLRRACRKAGVPFVIGGAS